MKKLKTLLLIGCFTNFGATFCHAATTAIDDCARPNEHFCPISQEVMRNPVVAEDGYSYEKEQLEMWINSCLEQGNDITSPMTRQNMTRGFLPNVVLRKMIEDWQPVAQTHRPTHQNSNRTAEKKIQDLHNQLRQSHSVMQEFQEQFNLMLQEKDNHIRKLEQQRWHHVQTYNQNINPSMTERGANSYQRTPVYQNPQYNPPVPHVARGCEDVYSTFLKAKLIYTNPYTQKKIEWVFGNIMHQLFQGNNYSVAFDLSQCDEHTKTQASINIGFRTRHNPANRNKVEVWIMPHFWLAAHINGSGSHYKSVFQKWIAYPAGIFWTWGNWDNKDGDCRHVFDQDYATLSNNNLYHKGWQGKKHCEQCHNPHMCSQIFIAQEIPGDILSNFIFKLI